MPETGRCLDEIEITPEMIEAGVDALFSDGILMEPGQGDAEACVGSIYSAMSRVSRDRGRRQVL